MTGTAWRHKEASHMVFTGRKQVEMEVGAQLSFSFLSFFFIPGRQPIRQSYSHSERVLS